MKKVRITITFPVPSWFQEQDADALAEAIAAKGKELLTLGGRKILPIIEKVKILEEG